MADNLFPEEEELILEEEEQSEDVKYLDGYRFENDFCLDGKNNIISCSSYESWVFWCKKALETPRGMCVNYDDDYGIDIESVFSANTHEEAENILSSEIRNTLINADPYNRTSYIESIQYDWEDGDSIFVTVSIVGHEEMNATIETTISI